MTPSMHPLAPHALPVFMTTPGSPDYLLIGMAFFLIAFVLATGLLFLRLHMLPDHIAHKSQKVQYEIVGVLGLLAMFTHINAFWIAGLLLALIDIPDFSTPLRCISEALDRIAARRRGLAISGVVGGSPVVGKAMPSASAAQPSRTKGQPSGSSGVGSAAPLQEVASPHEP